MPNTATTTGNPAQAFCMATPLILFLAPLVAAVPVDEPDPEPIGSPTFWWKLVISVALILSGGAFAGLTIGLMGLDELHLRVLATSSDDAKEKQNAKHGMSCLSRL